MAQGYPTDLVDAEWAVLQPLLSAAKPGGRPRTTCLRQHSVSPWPYLAEVVRQRRKDLPAPALPIPALS
jgi:transposase